MLCLLVSGDRLTRQTRSELPFYGIALTVNAMLALNQHESLTHPHSVRACSVISVVLRIFVVYFFGSLISDAPRHLRNLSSVGICGNMTNGTVEIRWRGSGERGWVMT